MLFVLYCGLKFLLAIMSPYRMGEEGNWWIQLNLSAIPHSYVERAIFCWCDARIHNLILNYAISFPVM